MNHAEVLNSIYQGAIALSAAEKFTPNLSEIVASQVEAIVARSESNKGLITVLITLLVHKIVDEKQDIRYHQAQLPNGFSGRTIDTTYVTPFMKQNSFPAMAESGWLTRSLEQAQPYTLDYPGKITPKEIKTAFLNIINEVQENGLQSEDVLLYFFVLLIKQRDSLNIELAKPHSLSISTIVDCLRKHFTYKYSCSGAARLPVLALYAAYQCMMKEVSRYNDKKLYPLESHTSADTRSGRIGDIDVHNSDETAFEGVEIKHEIQIDRQLVLDAYEKFKIYNTDRYYLLTTADMSSVDMTDIEKEINRIRQIHGCQIIVNGVYSTLKYYLRLLSDTAKFVDYYVELVKQDETIKFPHKEAWNKIISEI